MADQLEGGRSLPVKFKDQGDGSVAEAIAIAGTVLVESSGPPTITAMTFNADGTIATYTEKRESDGKTRTVTRTYAGSNWTQAIGAWA